MHKGSLDSAVYDKEKLQISMSISKGLWYMYAVQYYEAFLILNCL